MHSTIRLVVVVAGLVLVLNITPSWGQPFINPTASDANNNTAGGSYALLNVSGGSSGGSNNTAFGYGALEDNRTGSHNTAVGVSALEVNSTTSYNTAIGEGALQFNQGDHNTATGSDALRHNFTGSYNAAHGLEALFSNNFGGGLTASGARALYANTTGNNNTASGAVALYSNATGSGNTADGVFALQNNIAGNNNTAVGFGALQNSTGTKNIAIGFHAGLTLSTGNNNIYLGNQGVSSSEFQTMRLGSTQTSTFIAGIGNASVSGATVEINTTTGQLGILTSSARYKQDIVPMASQSEGVLQLRPVTFAYKQDTQHTKHYGLIAEEVEKVYPDLVTHTATGEVQAVRYQELIPMLVNELKRQQSELAEVGALRKELAELRALVGQGREMAASSR